MYFTFRNFFIFKKKDRSETNYLKTYWTDFHILSPVAGIRGVARFHKVHGMQRSVFPVGIGVW